MAPIVTSRNVLQQSQNHEMPLKSASVLQNKPMQQPPPKKTPRRSSGPIINWFQRKLAGTVKSKKSSKGMQPAGSGREARRGKNHGLVANCSPQPRTNAIKQSNKVDGARQKPVPPNREEAKDSSAPPHVDDEGSADDCSLAFESAWSPTSRMEADEDASVRPMPPSAPPSPSPSRSSSSYPRTFRSMAASTKPTTLLSVDLPPNGVAHIAQVPATPVSQVSWFPPHVRTASTNTNPVPGSGTSVTFSALPPSPQSSRPSSTRNLASMIPSNPASQHHTLSANIGPILSVQAPLHTTHHPRNNPRPSSPPSDNASMLTLASSAFAFSSSRVGQPGWGSASPSAIGGNDSLSHFGGSLHGGYGDTESASQSVLGDDDRLEERDVDASVRALRPRSSRRGSWDSETSDWSARVHGIGTPSFARERSFRTTNSVRTGGAEDADKQPNGFVEDTAQSSQEGQTIAGSVDTESKADTDYLPPPPPSDTEPTSTKMERPDVVDSTIPVSIVEQSTDVAAIEDSLLVSQEQSSKDSNSREELNEAAD